MRFSAAFQPQLPPHNPAAADSLRQRLLAAIQPKPVSEPVRPKDLPADLDQRVRLVGEW